MRKLSRPAPSIGLAPGTLKPHPNAAELPPVRVSFFDYDESHLDEGSVDDIAKCLEPIARGRTTWINVDGVHDSPTVEALGQHFDLHPLVLEDIVTPAQRSKVEQYGESTYIVVRTLRRSRWPS